MILFGGAHEDRDDQPVTQILGKLLIHLPGRRDGIFKQLFQKIVIEIGQ